MPVLKYAVPDTGTDEYDLYRSLMAHWDLRVYEIVTQAADSAAVAESWNVLMRELETMGLEKLEAGMTERFVQHLARYQKAGYYTEIQVK